MASKPVPLAERFKEMILARGNAAAASSEDPLDSILAAGAHEKRKAALEHTAATGGYLEQKEARAALDGMAAADEKAKYEQARKVLPGMSSAEFDAVDVGALTPGDRKAYLEEGRRRTKATKERLAELQDELDEAEGVISLDDGYDAESADEVDALLELADDDADGEVEQDEVSWVPPLGFGYEGAEN